MKIFIDCEFDGHTGKLMSIAAITLFGDEIYIICEDHADPQDPWVVENVLPQITRHNCKNTHFVPQNEVGDLLRAWLMQFYRIEIIAGSPLDIYRFAQALSTDALGNYAPNTFPTMFFRVYDVNAYPTKLSNAVQHNAWWDAKALGAKLYCEGLS